MTELEALRVLAEALGVATEYTDDLGRHVSVGPDTLVAVCAALGGELRNPADAEGALAAHRAALENRPVPPVLVAWDGHLRDGHLRAGRLRDGRPVAARIDLEDGSALHLAPPDDANATLPVLPPGYHRLTLDTAGPAETCSIVSAPARAWHRPGACRGWGVGAHLSALRSRRSRSVGDLRDLESLCRWTASRGGDVVTVLPLLPTFNQPPSEPSPYSPVTRLFWSELVLDLGDRHRPAEGLVPRLDVARADREVRAALAGLPPPPPLRPDHELERYARFRGAQARLGRDWRRWPEPARSGAIPYELVDPHEEAFHLAAQTMVASQLAELLRSLDAVGVRLGLDLPVGVHPDGYDPWSRQELFASGMSVGAPPDRGFPSGQNWGFAPVLPGASRREGHAYFAASLAHQARLGGLLRIDHVMALARLYWIPHGAPLNGGTYVRYPAEELFAVLALESHRNRCEMFGEDLGVVPAEVRRALRRHDVPGTFLAEFATGEEPLRAPTRDLVALIGTHDNPTLAGWLAGADIDERVRYGLLAAEDQDEEHEMRRDSISRLADALGGDASRPGALLETILEWLGRSDSRLVIPWLEDLWLEPEQVNLPGTTSSERPNWQRPMSRVLEDALEDPDVLARVERLRESRAHRADAEDADRAEADADRAGTDADRAGADSRGAP